MVDGKGQKRTLETVQREYTQMCTSLGDVTYKIGALDIAKRNIEKSLRQLNKEAARMQNKEQPAEPEVTNE